MIATLLAILFWATTTVSYSPHRLSRRHSRTGLSASGQQAEQRKELNDEYRGLVWSAGQQQRPSEYYEDFLDDLPSMAGQVVAITGASRGLGFVTAMALATKGATLLLLNRRVVSSAEEGENSAFAAIAAAAAGPAPIAVRCDLLDFTSVRSAAAEVARLANAAPKAGDGEGGGLDVLCLNAGVMMEADVASADGYDRTIATNVLSHFLLARDLMPSLERAAAGPRGEARVVSMSSGSGFGGPPFDAAFLAAGSGGRLGGARRSYERYHQSKLANLLFTAALHDKLEAKDARGSRRRSSSGSGSGHDGGSGRSNGGRVKALACTPGVCGSDMFARVSTMNDPSKRGPEDADLSRVPSVEDGCLAQLKCICDPSVRCGELWGPPMGGGLPVRVALAPPTVLVDGDAKAALWRACEDAVGGSFALLPEDDVDTDDDDDDDDSDSRRAGPVGATDTNGGGVAVVVGVEGGGGGGGGGGAVGGGEGGSGGVNPLLILSQVGLNAAIGAGLVYCYLVRAGADNGEAWTAEALAHSDEWLFGAVGLVFGRPPGGPLTLALAALNFGTVLGRLLNFGIVLGGDDDVADNDNDSGGGDSRRRSGEFEEEEEAQE